MTSNNKTNKQRLLDKEAIDQEQRRSVYDDDLDLFFMQDNFETIPSDWNDLTPKKDSNGKLQ